MKIKLIAKIKDVALGYLIGTESEITIGRELGNTIAPIVDNLSRHHAKIYFKDGAWFAEDLGSTNGSYLNGNKIEAPTKLKAGDSLRFGLIDITVGFEEEAAAPAPVAAAEPPKATPTVAKTAAPTVAKPAPVVLKAAPAAPKPAPKPAAAPVADLKPVEPVKLEPVADLTPVEPAAPAAAAPASPISPITPANKPTIRKPTIGGGMKPGLKLPPKPGALGAGLKLPPKPGALGAGLKLPPKPTLKLPTKPAAS